MGGEDGLSLRLRYLLHIMIEVPKWYQSTQEERCDECNDRNDAYRAEHGLQKHAAYDIIDGSR